jgi:hypothetical protein
MPNGMTLQTVCYPLSCSSLLIHPFKIDLIFQVQMVDVKYLFSNFNETKPTLVLMYQIDEILFNGS